MPPESSTPTTAASILNDMVSTRHRTALWVTVVAILTLGSLLFVVRTRTGNTERVHVRFLDCGNSLSFTGTFQSRDQWWVAAEAPAEQYRGRDVTGTVTFVSDNKATFAEDDGPTIAFDGSTKPVLAGCPMDP